MKAFLALILATLLASNHALAQSTPPRGAVTLVAPFAPGGPTDLLTRIVATRMSELLSQTIVVENISGASGTIGSSRVARARPDGQTILMGNLGSHASAVAVFGPRMPYDPIQDFAPIGLVATGEAVLVVRPDFPARDMQGFIAHAKANPDVVTYGAAGIGSTSHVFCAALGSAVGAQLRAIQYRGSGPAMQDLMAGRIDGLCALPVEALPLVRRGAVRALVGAGESRSSLLPEVPTLPDLGLPAWRAVAWNALFAPRGTPADVVARFGNALNATLNDAAVSTRLSELGVLLPHPEQRGPEHLTDFVQSEISYWSEIVGSAGIILE